MSTGPLRTALKCVRRTISIYSHQPHSQARTASAPREMASACSFSPQGREGSVHPIFSTLPKGLVSVSTHPEHWWNQQLSTKENRGTACCTQHSSTSLGRKKFHKNLSFLHREKERSGVEWLQCPNSWYSSQTPGARDLGFLKRNQEIPEIRNLHA